MRIRDTEEVLDLIDHPVPVLVDILFREAPGGVTLQVHNVHLCLVLHCLFCCASGAWDVRQHVTNVELRERERESDCNLW
jgi:hypothetical protein